MTWVDLVVLACWRSPACSPSCAAWCARCWASAPGSGAIFAGVWALPRVRPQFQEWLGASPWVDPVAFGVVFLVSLIVLMLIARWIGGAGARLGARRG